MCIQHRNEESVFFSNFFSRGVDRLLRDVQQCSIIGLDQILGSVSRCGLKGEGGKRMEGKWG